MQVTWSLVAGGSEMYAFTVASNLDPAGYESLICALDKGGPLEPEVLRAGIPYTIMGRRPGIEIGLMWKLFKLFRSTGVSVIHTHHFNQLFYSFLGAKLAGARIIHTEHSVDYLKRKKLRIALRVLSVFCEKFTAIGDDGFRFLRDQVRIPTGKLAIIRAGVDVAAFSNESRSEARQALGLNPEDRVACIVARLFPEKNHRMLLAAFSDVLRSVDGARLLIVGEGSEHDAIRDEIERRGLASNVTMLGVRRDISRILAASDLFVLSSDREGLPIAVLEALASARPVAATSVGDVPTVVLEGETGVLVAPKDPAALSIAIARLLSDPELSVRMGRNGRNLIDANYSLRAMIEQHELLYSGNAFNSA
jgi:glycosyltransferase involved in cell wall biosynthesis